MSRPQPDPSSADACRGFYADILYFLRKRTDNASDAADMAQDVFTQWLGYRDRAKVEQPRAFLFQMARNLLRDHWRKQKVRQAVHSDQAEMDAEPVTDEQNDPMAAAQRIQRLEQLKEVLAELSPRRRGSGSPRTPHAGPRRRGSSCGPWSRSRRASALSRWPG